MTLSAIRSLTGADYAINGTLYDMAKWMPVMHYRVDGQTMVSDPYNYYGYGWNDKDIRVVQSKDKNNVRNYICGVELVRDGKLCLTLCYDSALGGVRGRTAIALTKSGDLMLYCVGDGEVGRCTPEELRGELLALGAQSAVMLDGGLSSQCIFPNSRVDSSRIVQNAILVYLKKEAITTHDYDCTVCLDAGHGGKDNSNGSPDGSYKEHEFSLDLAKRIKALLIAQGIKVIMTRESDMFVDLKPRANIANAAKATLYLSIHSNATGGGGWSSPSGLVAYTYDVGGKRDDLANAILSRMREVGVKIFGSALYHAKFAVLKYTNMPACLVEFGFHTNYDDVALLKTSAYRDKLALATAKAICDYLRKPYKETSKRYIVTVAQFENKSAAQAVVGKLAEIGIKAEITEVDE
jgi:N-acetylmuramoyl-L-alanine amidase